ncbi:hypothetical protein FISHEDRAFT_78658 [Fistulina hepatica ATCC 64428]|uniref:Uncharacterized protein n=1 Tax=Fistulina hepatica ATCC 64428 TaxID=1128425 RepID=A0A0D7A0A5_9AGAR|nr:hypothetical protein FISHEDRAFT_78658 [Fistulina hepatica ATCC 64428]
MSSLIDDALIGAYSASTWVGIDGDICDTATDGINYDGSATSISWREYHFDDVPGCTEPNTLDTVCRRICLTVYLWQAYTTAEMHCQGFGSHAFRLEEAWMPDSLSVFRGGTFATSAVQQGSTSDKLQPDLFGITLEALRSYFLTSVQQQQRYVAAMFLDSARDPKTGRIVGHTAVTLMSALNDMRPVDQRYCDIDAEGKMYWMAANIGIGAWMHEVDRSVCAIEPLPSPNKVEWGECQWHALDMLHFVRHLCFTLPSDPAQPVGDFAHTSINIFGTEDGPHIACAAGILLIELYDVGGRREFPKTHLSFTNAHPPPTEHMVSHMMLSSISPGKGTEPGYVRMQIFSCMSGMEPIDVPDVGTLLHTVRDAAPPVALAIGTLFVPAFSYPPIAIFYIHFPRGSIQIAPEPSTTHPATFS